MRFVRIALGLFIAFCIPHKAYIPTSAFGIGYDLVELGLCYLAGWLIYRGFRPATKPASLQQAKHRAVVPDPLPTSRYQ